MSTLRRTGSKAPPSDPRALWAEALWGLGLIGSVLILVALIAAMFSR